MKQALVDERLKRVRVRIGYAFRRVIRRTPGYDREPREDLALRLAQEVVRPSNRRAEGPLARIGVAATLQQLEPFPKSLDELCWGEESCTRRRELYRERQRIEPRAQLLDVRRLLDLQPLLSGARQEQLDRVVVGHRGHDIDALAGDLKPLAARDEQRRVAERLAACKLVGDRRQQVLPIVEQHKRPLVGEGATKRGGD